MTDWDSIIMHLRATPGEELMVVAGAGTARCRPLADKGFRIRTQRVSKSPARFNIYATQPVAEQPAYRIMTLVEMCSGALHEVGGEAAPEVQAAFGWLRANPGRWFLVGEQERDWATRSRERMGMDVSTVKHHGFEHAMLNNKLYARMPHPDGRPLTDFVTPARKQRSEPLPMLQRDKFDWSLSELRSAASTAREWLSGSVGSAHGYAAA